MLGQQRIGADRNACPRGRPEDGDKCSDNEELADAGAFAVSEFGVSPQPLNREHHGDPAGKTGDEAHVGGVPFKHPDPAAARKRLLCGEQGRTAPGWRGGIDPFEHVSDECVSAHGNEAADAEYNYTNERPLPPTSMKVLSSYVKNEEKA